MANEEKGSKCFPVYQTILNRGGFPAHCCHRGGAGNFGPENTMYNFRRCVWEFATQVIETDLQLTSDGHLVLLHDPTVDRTTNGNGQAKDMTLEELRKLDAASNFPELKGQGIQIPTFEEFLDEFIPEEHLVFFLDFKEEEAVYKAMEIIHARKIEDRILLGSVSTEANKILALLKKDHVPLLTDVDTTVAIVMSLLSGTLDALPIQHDIVGYILEPRTQMFWNQNLVDAVHKRGLRFVVAGVDTIPQLKQCVEWGVDFIVTDRPDLLREVLDQK